MLISYLDDVAIQSILEFKDSFEKYNLVFPNNPLKGFLGNAVYSITINDSPVVSISDKDHLFQIENA